MLGTPSSVVEDLDTYLLTLNHLLTLNIDYLLLPHSVSLDAQNILVSAPAKLKAYIEYREDRLKQMLQAFNSGATTRQQLYDRLYGDRDLTGQLQAMAYHNLDLQIKKLVKDGCMHSEMPKEFHSLTLIQMCSASKQCAHTRGPRHHEYLHQLRPLAIRQNRGWLSAI